MNPTPKFENTCPACAAALEIVSMMRREIPRTIGEVNLVVLMDDLEKVAKLLGHNAGGNRPLPAKGE